MSAQTFETILARLYTNEAFRRSFLHDPETALLNADLSSSEKQDLLALDKAGLIMAARSFAHKRKQRLRK